MSLDHSDGHAKARYLALLGYTREHWEQLARDLRQQILPLDAQPAGKSRWGVRYEILGVLRTMSLELYGRAVLIDDLPDKGLRARDVGVVVEHYEARGETPEGYELEFLSARGETVAVVSVPASAVRAADSHELLTVRRFRAS